MFGKKNAPAPAPKAILSVQILTQDFAIDGQLQDGLEEGIISPWLMRLGNPTAEQLRGTVRLSAVRWQSANSLTAPASPMNQFDVWLGGVIAVGLPDAAGTQAVTAWAQKTMRKRQLRGTFYVGSYVIQGTAFTKETSGAPELGFLFALMDATISSAAPGSQLLNLRAPAMVVGTSRMLGYNDG